MQRFATGPVILAFVFFTIWTVVGATRVALAADRDDPNVSWTGIGLLYVVAAAAAWFAFRLYRIRRAKRR
jgi:hypothetical protein